MDRDNPFAQLVSFRPQLLAAGAVLLGGLLAVPRARGGLRPLLAGLAAVWLLGAAMVAPRAVPDPAPTGGRPLVVLGFNTFEGRADPAALAALIRTERPDVVALPEAGARFGSRLAPLVEPLGYRLYGSADPDPRDVSNVLAAVAAALGPVRVQTSGAADPFPFVEATGGQLGALRVAAVHTRAPRPGTVDRWQADLADLQRWCAGPTPAIVAGDLNATLDHSPLRAGMAGCADAAALRGAGLEPTWSPSPRTRLLGPQIDHVLLTPGIGAEAFTVRDLPGSDHRAILAHLRLPSPHPDVIGIGGYSPPRR